MSREGNLSHSCYFHRKKYEIATDEPGNPIKQDEKKGQLREVRDSQRPRQIRKQNFRFSPATAYYLSTVQEGRYFL